MQTASWKTAQQVTRLDVTHTGTSPLFLGKGRYGRVYMGRIRFGRSPIRVAIKKFEPEGMLRQMRGGRSGPLTDEEAAAYQKAIDDIRRESGSRMPKMGVYKVRAEDARRNPGALQEGEWVIVSQLFGNSEGSRIQSPVNDRSRIGETENRIRRRIPMELKKSIVEQASAIANAGYYPSVDAVSFPTGLRGHAFMLDLDVPALLRTRPALGKEQNDAYAAKALINHIHALATTPFQAQVLYNHIMKRLHPVRASGIRRELQTYRPVEYHLFFSPFFHQHDRVVQTLRDAKRPLTFKELLHETGLKPGELRTSLRHLGAHGKIPEPNKTRQGPTQIVRIRDGKYEFAPPYPQWSSFEPYGHGYHAFG